MSAIVSEATDFADTINALQEPYRHHAIEWLESCAQCSFAELSHDMGLFLQDLPPVVRDTFVRYTRSLLEEAVRYFGIR